jgi:hypothetical protein
VRNAKGTVTLVYADGSLSDPTEMGDVTFYGGMLTFTQMEFKTHRGTVIGYVAQSGLWKIFGWLDPAAYTFGGGTYTLTHFDITLLAESIQA